MLLNQDSILASGSNPVFHSLRARSVRSEPRSQRTTRSHRSHRTSIHSVHPKPVAELWPVLSNPRVLVALSGTIYGASCQGLLEACLEPYLETFDMTITQIGLTFLGLSVPYFIASPLWGHTCDHWVDPKVIQPIGHVLVAIGFVLLGPASYIPESVSFF
jgi:predicted MFS family arabinose efflux permease